MFDLRRTRLEPNKTLKIDQKWFMTEIRTCYLVFFHLFWKKVKFHCFVLYVPMYFEWATLIMFLIAFFSYKLLNNMAKYVNCHYLITCLTKNDYNLHFTLSSGPAELGTSKESSIFIDLQIQYWLYVSRYFELHGTLVNM